MESTKRSDHSLGEEEMNSVLLTGIAVLAVLAGFYGVGIHMYINPARYRDLNPIAKKFPKFFTERYFKFVALWCLLLGSVVILAFVAYWATGGFQ